jgi:hypothetical protein
VFTWSRPRARVTVPALYVAGDRDLLVAFRGMDQLILNLTKFVPQLRETIMLPGCGHWTQQARAREVNTAIIDFLRGLWAGSRCLAASPARGGCRAKQCALGRVESAIDAVRFRPSLTAEVIGRSMISGRR